MNPTQSVGPTEAHSLLSSFVNAPTKLLLFFKKTANFYQFLNQMYQLALICNDKELYAPTTAV